MPTITISLFRLWPFALSLLLYRAAVAQACPHGEIPSEQFIALIKTTDSADVIYRSAAIAGTSLIPTIKQLSKPGLDAGVVPGAAQVSLARLGDKASLNELRDELNSQHGGDSIEKLLRVGSNEAIAALMGYLHNHANDAALSRRYGDYTVDTRLAILKGIARLIPNPPADSSGGFDLSIQTWLDLWNQGKIQALSLPMPADEYLQCLARKIEWGFPDAILDLANTGDMRVVPALQILTRVGDQASTLNTISGRARFALAKLGDQAEFSRVVKGLETSGYPGVIEELRLIGGKEAVGALVNALGDPNFLPEHKQYQQMYAREVNDRDKAIEDALSKLVSSPPRAKPNQNKKELWKEWWYRNKQSVQLVATQTRTYE